MFKDKVSKIGFLLRWPRSICKSISGLISLDGSWRSPVQQCRSSRALTFELISNSDGKTGNYNLCVHLSEVNIFPQSIIQMGNHWITGKLSSSLFWRRYIPQSDNIFIGIVGRDKCIFRGEDSTESRFLKGGYHKSNLFLIFDCPNHYLHPPSPNLNYLAWKK